MVACLNQKRLVLEHSITKEVNLSRHQTVGAVCTEISYLLTVILFKTSELQSKNHKPA